MRFDITISLYVENDMHLPLYTILHAEGIWTMLICLCLCDDDIVLAFWQSFSSVASACLPQVSSFYHRPS